MRIRDIVSGPVFRSGAVAVCSFLTIVGSAYAVTTISSDVTTDGEVSSGTQYTLTSGEDSGAMFIDTTGQFGDANDWTPENTGNGFWLESIVGGESAGIFLNENTSAIWSPGDTDYILGVYDEDDLSEDTPDNVYPRFGVTSNGGIWVGNHGATPDFVDNPPELGDGFFEGNLEVDGILVPGENSSFINGYYSSTASLDFDGTTDSCEDETMTVTGAEVGDAVTLGLPTSLAGGVSAWFTGYVSGADEVTVRMCSFGATGDPAAANVRADVWSQPEL